MTLLYSKSFETRGQGYWCGNILIKELFKKETKQKILSNIQISQLSQIVLQDSIL